jgi:transcriptional regulator with XRE-family HTH domain
MYSDDKRKKMLTAAGDDKTLDTLGGRIRAVRKARGLKVGRTSAEIGVSRTTFSAWEADAVKNPDINKLGKFVALTDVSLTWLIKRQGDDPDLTVPAPRRRRSSASSPPERGSQLGSGNSPGGEPPIPEIAAPLSAHAKAFDLTARAFWTVPRQVLEIGFNSLPETTVVKRVVTRGGSEFGLSRGDYVLIDTSRTRVDEPGMYIIPDPEGLSARRALVVEENGKLKIAAVADDVNRDYPQISVDNLTALGRVMGIIKPG